MVDKDRLREQFAREWQKHYDLEVLKELGFKRQVCKKCGKHFWAIEERERCGDASCVGYSFIDNPPTPKRLSYVETWNIIKDYFTSHGHGYVEPYPVVARWRDDMYFTLASIGDFQPYVVNGELEPPANPLIIPQPCLRFNDIDNVGLTGRHYTNFVMIGQHAFNTEKTGLFYWKEEAIRHDIGFLRKLGIPLEEIVFVEDVWAGGGNFGPSLEYFVRGLELGNCVFMQFEERNGVVRELKTKVIDMGAGLGRLAWITHGTPSSYEIVLGPVVDELKRTVGVGDERLFHDFAKYSAYLNAEELKDDSVWQYISKELGVDERVLKDEVERWRAAYSIADHTLTLLFTTLDGQLPSNSGGGYNLRILARRIFSFEDVFGFHLDFAHVLQQHVQHLKDLFPRLAQGVESTAHVLEEERKKYEKSKENVYRKVEAVVKRGTPVSTEELLMLYKSHGVDPFVLKKRAEQYGVRVDVPANFFDLVREKDEVEVKEERLDYDLPPTQPLYYTTLSEFSATVLKVVGNDVVLDRTAFYPEGGGQIYDTGVIEGRRVLAVHKRAGVVFHTLESVEGLKEGQQVRAQVDIERRKDITRKHTAAHLLLAAAREVLGPHVWQAGSDIKERYGHMDITHYKRITPEELEQIERKVNEYILMNKPINVYVMPRTMAEQRFGFRLYQGGAIPSKVLRVVEIEGVDAEACGGTHHMLSSTAEIGFFKILRRESVQDGVERIVFTAGYSAVDMVKQLENTLDNACEVLRVGRSELVKTVKRFFDEWKALRKENEALRERLVQFYVDKVLKSEEDYVEVDDEMLVGLAKALAGKKDVVLVTKSRRFAVVGKSEDSAERLMERVRASGGRGGGRGLVRFGSFK
jgi:alanyl-tRNA synthetase